MDRKQIMINVIFYSKNRAMQLEACIRSFKKHFKEYNNAKKHVVFKTTDKDFVNGYKILMQEHSDVNYVPETHFKNDTKNLVMANKDKDFTMFVMDDIIFKNDFSLNDSIFSMLKDNPHMLAISLRLHKGISYCYAIDKKINLPNFVRDVPDKFCVWNYPGCEGDWGYGYSLDANIYNTKYILPLLFNGQYDNPNTLEALLNSPQILTNGIVATHMCCYPKESKLINVPANRVQNVFPNRYDKSWDENQLNEKFLNGERLSLENVTNIDTNAVHYPLEYKFYKK